MFIWGSRIAPDDAWRAYGGDVDDGSAPDSLGESDGELGPAVGAGLLDAEVVYSNLGSQLSALAVASADGGEAAQAGGTNATSGGASLLLAIQLDGNRDGVLEFLADNGVTPANVLGDYLEVELPPVLQGALAGQNGVSRVRRMPLAFSDRGAVVGQGDVAFAD